MSANWTKRPLSEVVSLRRGFDLPASNRVDGSFPILSAGKRVGTHSEAKVPGPGFAIGRATSLGTPTWSESDYWPLNTTLYAEDFKGNNPRWLFHLFEVLDLTGFNSGSVQPMLNRNYIAQVQIGLPPRWIQDGIAEVVGALDGKIAANRLLVDAIDGLIRDSVRARLTEPSRLWDALDVKFGEAFKGDAFSAPGTGRALVRIRDLKSQKCQVWTTERRVNEFEVRPGDLLVGMDAEFRATRWSGPLGVLNQRVLAVSSTKYGTAIAREMLASPLHRIEHGKTGTTVIHLNKRDLVDEILLVPGDAEVPALRARVDPLWHRAVAAEQESVSLATTRDELLPLLMSGKITVKDAEKTVEEVV